MKRIFISILVCAILIFADDHNYEKNTPKLSVISPPELVEKIKEMNQSK